MGEEGVSGRKKEKKIGTLGRRFIFPILLLRPYNPHTITRPPTSLISPPHQIAISAYTRGYCAPTGGRNFSPVCAATSNFNSTLPGSSGKPPGSPQANSTSAYKPSAPVNTVSPYQGLAGRSAALGFGMVVVLGMGMGVALGGI